MTTPNRGNIAPKDFHIAPSMIGVDRHLFDAFDHHETEVSALWLVQFMQAKREWTPFSQKEINDFYNEQRGTKGEMFGFNRLLDPVTVRRAHGNVQEGGGWVVRGDGGLYHITGGFVLRCFNSNPNQKTT